jgi:transposase
MIHRFREEVLGELYQLIEFVLVNNSARSKRAGSALPPKHLLQERLASLTNPQNTQQKNVTNLRVLDAYLNEQNSEALIKDAINIAKPFFFTNVINERLDQEARKVFDAFKAESTGDHVLQYYVFNMWYPEARQLSTFQKMMNYNEDRDKLGYLESLFPDRSRHYAMRSYLSMMGQNVQATSVGELESATHGAYETLAQMREKFD